MRVVWGLTGLAGIDSQKKWMFPIFGSLEGDRVNITCCQTPPPCFSQHFYAGEKKGSLDGKNV